MNQHLHELAEAAGFTADKYGLYWDQNNNSEGIDLEKFAQSIVQHCVWAAYANHAVCRNNATYKFTDSLDAVKLKFGLE